jgi:hypothetical protein
MRVRRGAWSGGGGGGDCEADLVLLQEGHQPGADSPPPALPGVPKRCRFVSVVGRLGFGHVRHGRSGNDWPLGVAVVRPHGVRRPPSRTHSLLLQSDERGVCAGAIAFRLLELRVLSARPRHGVVDYVDGSRYTSSPTALHALYG